jgi:uridylate kinase
MPPAETLQFTRVLLKLSGESLKGNLSFGVDPKAALFVANQISGVRQMGVDIAVVVGGGNIWRGREAEAQGMDRVTADYSGMLATVINALALQDALETEGVPTRVQTALSIQSVAEPYIRRRAIRHLEKGRVVIFAGGTGNPYMTTDTAAALRSIEIEAKVMLMAKNNVDGVYDSDPHKNPNAKMFKHLSCSEAMNLRLDIMDSTALSLCLDNQLPVIVFNLFKSGTLLRIIAGEQIGTMIKETQEPTNPGAMP